MNEDYSKLFTPINLSRYDPRNNSQPYLNAHRVPYRPFLEITREIENSKETPRGGWNKDLKLWFPHKSQERGRKTIGYGHKLTKEEEKSGKYSKGLTAHQVDSLYKEDIKEHYSRAKFQFEKLYNKSFDELPAEKQAILIDYEYTGTGPKAFPNFTKALVEDDKETLKKEYPRYMGKKPLGTRNSVTKWFLNLRKGGLMAAPRKSRLVKNAEVLNTKRDMRKKVIKSTTPAPDIKRKIYKKQDGGILDDQFISYINVPTPEVNLNSVSMNTYSFDPYSYISHKPFKEEAAEKPAITETMETTEPLVAPSIQTSPAPKPVKVDTSNFDPTYGLMKGFIDTATEENLPFRVTSGYRPNAVTSNGSASWHSKGLALDITPARGVSWKEFRDRLSKSPKTLRWLKENNIGIIDETSKEMLAKTGGTGAHFHIGRDKLAVETFNKWFPNLS